jgi:hypothetical protein
MNQQRYRDFEYHVSLVDGAACDLVDGDRVLTKFLSAMSIFIEVGLRVVLSDS